jgi:phage tail sheath protein FI
MYAYRTPGVRFEWIDVQPPVLPVRTDITGFVGVAERGPLHTPVKIESWAQFTGNFGSHIPQAYLAYAVQGFFENGGRTCWIVRVADPDRARPSAIDCGELMSSGEGVFPSFRLVAKSPGEWGMNLRCTIIRTLGDRFWLALQLPDGTQETWRDLTLDPEDSRYIKKLLNDGQNGSRLVLVTDPDAGSSTDGISLDGGTGYLKGGSAGLTTLRPEHLSSENSPLHKPWGLAALEAIDEVSIVAMPDIMPKPVVKTSGIKPKPVHCDVLDAEPVPPLIPELPMEFPPVFTPTEIDLLQAALIQHCESLKDRVAILELLEEGDERVNDVTDVIGWRNKFNSKYASLYYPWVLMPDPLKLQGLLRAIPPSGHVAGIYARGDRRIGVHKPPANELVEAVKDVKTEVDETIHGILNDNSVNVIRTFSGRGIRVAGARTLSRDTDWLYVNVRRLLIMIEEAIDEATQWTVFEPNNPDLWREIDREVRSFLNTLWRRGMLDGATAEDAYFVRCDETTNPPEEVENGRVTCLVGVQPPWPAEFVVVRIGKTQGATEIVELRGGRDG